jgi:alpha-1,6-mannosyltransferase
VALNGTGVALPSGVDRWSRRRLGASAVTGALVGSVLVVAAARLSKPEPAQRLLLGSWLGLLPTRLPGSGQALLTVVVLVAVVALVALWAAAVRACARGRVGLRGATITATAWSAPFVVGPPLFSRDVYSFIAQGQLALHGHDPYRSGPALLGHTPIVAAVDPRWRDALTPYGPLAVRLEELAAHAGSSVAAVLVLRALALVAVVVAVVVAIRLAHPRPPAAVVALYAMNPIVLFHLESGAHLEAPMVALALAGLLAHRRGHPVIGILLVMAAGAVKAPAFLAVGVLLVVDVRQARDGATRARVLARDGAATLAGLGGCYLLSSDPWGWLRALNNADAARTLATPAVALGHFVAASLRGVHLDVSTTVGLTLSTAVLAAVALAFIGRLLATSGRRDLLRTAGLALLLVSVLGPVTHPWYLLWGYALLMPGAAGGAVRTRKVLLVSSGLMATMEMPGLQGLVAPPVVWLVGIAVLGLVLLATTRRELPSGAPAGPLHWLRSIPRVLAGA